MLSTKQANGSKCISGVTTGTMVCVTSCTSCDMCRLALSPAPPKQEKRRSMGWSYVLVCTGSPGICDACVGPMCGYRYGRGIAGLHGNIGYPALREPKIRPFGT